MRIHSVPSDIGEYFRYDESAGKLYRIKDLPTARRKRAGHEAGSRPSADGYVFVRFRGVKHPIGHVIWFLKTGERAIEIDHIDMDPSNNRWGNLRPASHSQNVTNRRGWGAHLKGAYFNRRHKKFFSTIRFGRKAFYLGSFDTEDEAHAAYVAAAKRLHGDFARLD